MNQTTKKQIKSLKEQVKYMREIGCDKLANLLVKDLEELQHEDPIATIEAGYVARDYSWEAVQEARAKYGRND